MDIVLFRNAYGGVRFKAEPDWARQLIDRCLPPEARSEMQKVKERVLAMLVERIDLLGFAIDDGNLPLLRTLSDTECEKLLLKICYTPRHERHVETIDEALRLLMQSIFT